jgi:hypothetical protein
MQPANEKSASNSRRRRRRRRITGDIVNNDLERRIENRMRNDLELSIFEIYWEELGGSVSG